ncbi:MAG: hypothetical protein JKY53_00635 [Flavobacteriales bacterium]|nr:hypothetical protein [Flavobacteriales bacterium]
MHPGLYGRLYNQVMLNQAYMKTVLANQCIILANQAEPKANHRLLYQKFQKEVYNQYKILIDKDKKQVIKNKPEN